MAVTKKGKDGKAVALRETAMTLNQAVTVWEELRAFLRGGATAALDLSPIKDCDTSGIQLLCSSIKTAENANKMFSIVTASACVKAAANRAGIQIDFGKN